MGVYTREIVELTVICEGYEVIIRCFTDTTVKKIASALSHKEGIPLSLTGDSEELDFSLTVGEIKDKRLETFRLESLVFP